MASQDELKEQIKRRLENIKVILSDTDTTAMKQVRLDNDIRGIQSTLSRIRDNNFKLAVHHLLKGIKQGKQLQLETIFPKKGKPQTTVLLDTQPHLSNNNFYQVAFYGENNSELYVTGSKEAIFLVLSYVYHGINCAGYLLSNLPDEGNAVFYQASTNYAEFRPAIDFVFDQISLEKIPAIKNGFQIDVTADDGFTTQLIISGNGIYPLLTVITCDTGYAHYVWDELQKETTKYPFVSYEASELLFFEQNIYSITIKKYQVHPEQSDISKSIYAKRMADAIANHKILYSTIDGVKLPYFYQESKTGELAEVAVPESPEKQPGKITNEISKPLAPPLQKDDLIVISDEQKCVMQNHSVDTKVMNIPIFSKENKTVYYEVPTKHCPKCNHYYVDTYHFNSLSRKGFICTQRISKADLIDNKKKGKFENLQSQSLLFLYGYNVNKQVGLSKFERQSILTSIIRAGIVPKRKVESHINWLIENRQNRKNMAEAVAKWEEDLHYVQNM